MPRCFARCCKNRQGSQTKLDFNLHVFPRSSKMIRKWLVATGQRFHNIESTVASIAEKGKNMFRMCSDHFAEDAYLTVGKSRRLKIDAVPSIFDRECSRARAGVSTFTQPSFRSVSSTAGVQSSSTVTTTAAAIYGEASTSIIEHRPTKRKRFMDHDYTAESSIYSFGNFVTQGTNTKPILTANQSCQCRHSDFCRSKKTQTIPFLGKQHVKTSTVEIIKKDASTCTDVELDRSIDEFAMAIDTSTPVKPRSSSQKSLFTTVVTPIYEVIDKTIVDVQSETQSSFETTQQAIKAALDDPTYEPDTDISLDLSPVEDLTVPEIVTDTKFLVFQTCLDQLLKRITVCNYNGVCRSPIVEQTKSIRGTLLVITATCENDHTTEVWRSQPMLGTKAAGNVLCSAAILFSGSHFAKVAEMFKILGMPFIHKTSHYVYQSSHLFPVINKHYKQQYQDIVNELQEKTLCLSGDGQCDSPGHCARYGIYSMSEENTSKIIECEVVEVTETTSSNAMEKVGFERCVERIQGNGLEIGIIATDRHVGIRSLMEKKYSRLRHEFDIWHYAKSLNKRLLALCKKKICKELVPWREAIVKHLWTSCCTSKGNVALLVERWTSILRHMTNEHLWHDGTLIHGCDHAELLEDSERERLWLEKNSFAYGQLSKLITDKNLLKDLQHMAHFCHTGHIEVFHSMVLKYRPKRVHFSMDGMVARTQLAVMHHNSNVKKQKATITTSTSNSGEVGEVRYETFYSKKTKTWKVKVVYEKSAIAHVYKLMLDVGRKLRGELEFDWVSRNVNMRKSVARTKRPRKRDLVLAHLPRIHARTSED